MKSWAYFAEAYKPTFIKQFYNDLDGIATLDEMAWIFDKKGNYYNSSRIYRFGGFFQSTMTFAVQDHFHQSFFFQPGYDYTINNGVVKMLANSYFMSDGALHPISKLQKMGLKAIPLKAIKLKNQSNWYKDFITSNPSRSSEGNGTYKYEYTSDSVICLIHVKKIGNDTLTQFYGANYNATCTSFL